MPGKPNAREISELKGINAVITPDLKFVVYNEQRRIIQVQLRQSVNDGWVMGNLFTRSILRLVLEGFYKMRLTALNASAGLNLRFDDSYTVLSASDSKHDRISVRLIMMAQNNEWLSCLHFNNPRKYFGVDHIYVSDDAGNLRRISYVDVKGNHYDLRVNFKVSGVQG